MKKKLTKDNIMGASTYIVVIVAFLILQLMLNQGKLNSTTKGFLVPACAYIVLAVSLNLLVGICGELSLGHAGFMGIGAFTGIITTALLADAIPNGTIRLIVALIVGGIMAGIMGFLIGIPVLRLRGDYLAIVTLAFGEIMKNIFGNLYLGVDSNGLHASIGSDTLSLAEGGKMIVSGPRGATLICVDTDAETSDEQFLGGIFGTGFFSVKDTEVWLQAYISEHGFVHSGGIGGMLMQYPIGMGREGLIQNNWVGGKITFFEDNKVRRAYCKAVIGELVKNMNYNHRISGNTTDDFQSEEVKTYERELRPETCENPEYTEKVVPSDCKTFGYTEYTCTSCGYTYRDHYTLHSHTVTNWQVLCPATTTEEGTSEGFCDSCGIRQTRVDPTLPEPTEPETTAPPETTQPPQQETTIPATTQPPTEPEAPKTEKAGFPVWARWLCGILGTAVLGAVIFVATEPKGKHLRKGK